MRDKHSLLPIVGQAMSLLFGTVSDLDLEMIQRSVHDLATNQESIIHNLEPSMMNPDDKIKELATYTTTHFARLEQFVNTFVTDKA